MNPVFSLRHLDVRYPGGVHAVRDVSLSLPRGRALALLGANGAGKSSLIGALLGMTPATGEGDILGAPLGKIPQPLFEKIGFVADGRTPPGHWTLKRYTDYLRPLYPTWDDKFRAELVAKFSLPENRRMAQFSRGMKMKASMVGALAFRPELLVLDEPFGGLDPLTREELIDGLLDLMEGGDWSILLSSHDIHEVERLSDSVAILDNGKLILHDDLDVLQSRYRRWSWAAASAPHDAQPPAGWLEIRRDGDRWSGIQPDRADDRHTAATLAGLFGPVADLRAESLDLRSILLAHLRATKVTVAPELLQV